MEQTSIVDGLIEASGDAQDIHIAASATLRARIRVRGNRNRLSIADDVVIDPATSATDPNDIATLIIEGDDNQITIGSGTFMALRLVVRGHGHRIEIGSRCMLRGRANLLGSGKGHLSIGDGTTMVDGSLQLHETGEIHIGKDCMISSQVYASISDMHPIYDLGTGSRINPPASIHIGNHVWAGLRCMILKGAQVGDGAVIAAGAIVSGAVPANTIVAGTPAKVVRENVAWRRDFDEAAPRIE